MAGMLSRRGLALFAALVAVQPTVAQSPESLPWARESLWTRPTLTDNWFGRAPALADCGFKFDASMTQFYQGVVDGGLDQRWAYGGRGDYFLAVDGEKAGLWKGFFINLHGETRIGQSVNGATGAFLPVNTGMLFPSPTDDVTALTGVVFTQALSENFAVYFGKINLLDSFAIDFAGGAGRDRFMNMGFLFNPILLRTVPYSALGAGAMILREGKPIASLTVVDAVDSPTTSGFPAFEQGAVLIADTRLPVTIAGLPGHQGIGGSWSSRNYTAVDRSSFAFVPREGVVAGQESASWNLYYQMDQYLYTLPDDPKVGWGMFGMAGIADGNPSPIRSYFSVGFGGNSLLPCRRRDTWGVGYYYLQTSTDLKNLAPRVLPLQNEQGYEVFYNMAVTPWFHLTADLQLIEPTRSRADQAFLVGLRAKIDF